MASEPAAIVTHVDQVVRAESIRRRFGQREVLRGLELDLAEGEFLAMAGRN